MFKLLSQVSISFIILVLLSQCSEPTYIGSGVIDEENKDAIYTDTFEIDARLIRLPSPKVSPIFDTINQNGTVSLFQRNYLLGAVTDDKTFGKYFAGMYTSFRHTSPLQIPQDKVNLKVDSIILTIAYKDTSVYGDQNSLQNLMIYEVDETMDPSGNYWAEQEFNLKGSVLHTEDDILFKPNEEILSEDTTSTGEPIYLPPHLRFKLDNSLGEKFLEASQNEISVDSLIDADLFSAFFPGVYVCPDTSKSNNAIARFDMNLSYSRLVLYYSHDDGSGNIIFDINRNCAVSNRLVNNYEGTIIKDHLQNNTPLLDVGYIHSMHGIGVLLDFPSLGELPEGLAVNKAELLVTNVDKNINEETLYPNPTNMRFMLVKEGVEEWERSLEYYLSTVEVDDTSSTDAIKTTYKIKISNYLQHEIITGEGGKLVLLVDPIANVASRIVFEGTDDTNENRIKLNLTYTEK